MKQERLFLSFIVALGVFAPLNAVERSLIDFTTYNDNIAQVVQQDQELYEQVIADKPELDIRNFGYPEVEMEVDDWNLENWRIELNSSADTVANNKDSKTKNTPSQKYGNVLGIRLKFHPWRNAFWASVKNAYSLPYTYPNGKFISQDENDQDNGLAVGFLANVGQIKRVYSWVYGLNYDYKYGVRVVNEFNQILEFGMGDTYFEGWRRLVWNNPYYLDDPNDWIPTKNPLYPTYFPYIKFDSLNFYKKEGISDPNFIGYIKDVSIEYDYALIREDKDIDDEAIWNILATEAMAKRVIMSKKLAEELLLRKNLLKLKKVNDNATAADNNATPDAQ